jgi:tetratricopeptide (TPR) repeat protein
MAWRGVGDERQAAEALQGYSPRGIEPAPPDPAVALMAARIASPQGLLRRGQRLSAAGRFDDALAAFEAGVRADPQHAELLTNLGIALANVGRTDEARRTLEQVLPDAPQPLKATAHATLGTLSDREGNDAGAALHYRAALNADAANDAVRVQLADALMRMGRAAEAAPLYVEILQRAPESRARLSLALARVRLGQFGAAKAELDRGLALQPDNLALNNALARLLAAAPDRGLRDGSRALSIAKGLLERSRHPEVVQTYAMALAAVGDFDHAARVQQQVADAHGSAAGAVPAEFIRLTLDRYRAGQAAERPWDPGDPIFQPRSPVVARAAGPRGS